VLGDIFGPDIFVVFIVFVLGVVGLVVPIWGIVDAASRPSDGGNTADFNIQTDPHPAVSTSSSWSWVNRDSPQVIQVAATNSSDIQHENNDAFYSGIIFGVVGGALIALITELVVPLRRQHGRHGH
jgi:Na+/proline symporter